MFEVPHVNFIRSCEVVVFAFFIASWTCVAVSVIVVVCSLCVLFSYQCVCVGVWFVAYVY